MWLGVLMVALHASLRRPGRSCDKFAAVCLLLVVFCILVRGTPRMYPGPLARLPCLRRAVWSYEGLRSAVEDGI